MLHVPWAQPDQVARELEELKYVPSEVVMTIQGVGVAGDPQVSGEDRSAPGGGGRPRPPGGSPAGGMGVTGDREEPGHRNNHGNRDTPPDPPLATAQQQRQGDDAGSGARGVLDSTSSAGAPAPPEAEVAARALVVAFYRGLGAEPGAVTAAIRRRDLAIARQLAAAGATPEEAEAYARETATASWPHGAGRPAEFRTRTAWLASAAPPRIHATWRPSPGHRTGVVGLMLDDLRERAMDLDDDRDPSAPPGNRQAEDAVIGSILKNSRVIGDLAVQLSAEDFTSRRHAAAYAAAIALARRQVPGGLRHVERRDGCTGRHELR